MGVGAEIYKTYFEGSGADVKLAIVVEFLSGADLAWKPLTKDDILAVAKLFGRNHRIPHSEAKMKHDFCYESWPWNTRAFGDHLNDPMWSRSRAFIEDYLRKNGIAGMTTLQEFYEYTVSRAEMAPSPAVFSHGDAWQANIYKLNDGSFRLNDYDNANIGPRIWDLQYFWIKLENSAEEKISIFEEYITTYVNEFNSGSQSAKTNVAEIMNEFVCHLPWHILQTASMFHLFSEKLENIKGWDALLLSAIDDIIKDPNSAKCVKAAEPKNEFFGKCDGEPKSNNVKIGEENSRRIVMEL
ncbi:unnamed protein product [Oikopleura dioica]|uniref:CHK kinase-like domain-containing protein n=1 Tax=Oikopleura dioica TaxID=34765 RepID=E4X6C3_OIKDI|nr:unnamed protein product [Oikopleura dioica]